MTAAMQGASPVLQGRKDVNAAMTPEAKKIRSARTRSMTAARKLIPQITEAAAAHATALGEGTVPGGDLAVLTVKYEQALDRLRLLDSLAGDTAGPGPDEAANGTAELQPGDIALLIQVLRGSQLVPEKVFGETGSPLSRAVGFAFPDGVLPPAPGTEPASGQPGAPA